MARRKWRQRGQPSPRDLIHEARQKLDQAASGLRSDAETTAAIREVEARVGALEYRVDAISATVEGRNA